jgi:hydrogenase nickel incorporation protein HypA/HybF
MHEMGIAEGILAVVLDAAEGHEVRRVQLRIGVLQAVTAESLQFWFERLAQETEAATAMLDIMETPAVLRCQRCGVESPMQQGLFACPACSSSEIDVISGDEVLVDAVELDVGWRRRPGADDRVPVDVPLSHLKEHAQAGGEPSRAGD